MVERLVEAAPQQEFCRKRGAVCAYDQNKRLANWDPMHRSFWRAAIAVSTLAPSAHDDLRLIVPWFYRSPLSRAQSARSFEQFRINVRFGSLADMCSANRLSALGQKRTWVLSSL